MKYQAWALLTLISLVGCSGKPVEPSQFADMQIPALTTETDTSGIVPGPSTSRAPWEMLTSPLDSADYLPLAVGACWEYEFEWWQRNLDGTYSTAFGTTSWTVTDSVTIPEGHYYEVRAQWVHTSETGYWFPTTDETRFRIHESINHRLTIDLVDTGKHLVTYIFLCNEMQAMLNTTPIYRYYSIHTTQDSLFSQYGYAPIHILNLTRFSGISLYKESHSANTSGWGHSYTLTRLSHL